MKKRVLSFVVAFAMVFSSFFSFMTPAMAASFTGYHEFVKGQTYTYPLYVNDNGKKIIAYCFNATKTWPGTLKAGGNSFNLKIEDATAQDFDDLSYTKVANKRDNVLKTVYYGYPYNKGGIQQEFGLSDMQFRAVTQAVIWRWTDNEALGYEGSFEALHNLTHVTEYVYNPDGSLVIENGYPKFTTEKVYNWTGAMTNAYYKLLNNADFTYPSNFELDLYKCTDNTFQNLLSTKLQENETFTPEAEISKVKLGGAPLAGAHIQIKDAKNAVVSDFVSTTGVEKVALDPGTYTFHEVAAPNGYDVVSDFTFTVDKDGNVSLKNVDANTATVENGRLVVTDQLETAVDLEISKQDIGGQPVKDAQISIKNAKGVEVANFVTKTGNEKVTLSPGTYTFTEIAAPNGYKAVSEFTFTVAKSGEVTLNNVSSNVAKMVDGCLVVTDQYEDQKVKISKVDLGGNEIEGASITVSGSDNGGNNIEPITWTSKKGETKEITVKPGTYTFHEETAPEGYKTVSDFTFTVEPSGKVVVNKVDSSVAKYENRKLIVTDRYKDQTVKIKKVDFGGTELAGAKIKVTGKVDGGSDITPIEWTSKEGETKEITVQPGTYTFHEVSAPNGYEAVSDFSFTVDTAGKVTLNNVDSNVAKLVDGVLTVTDELSGQSVEISKTDVGGKELAGAKLSVTGKDISGKEITPITWTSGNETKKISVQPGTYTLTETTAPKGYEVAESITFEVSLDEDGNKVVTVDGKKNDGKITMVDAYSDQTVEISKTDVGGKELPGAKLSVTGKDAEGKDITPIEWTSGKETKKISVQPGTYTLTETTAPKGYEVAESITFKVSLDENGNKVVTVDGKDNNGKVTMVDAYSDQTVEISKTDVGGKELAGAKLSVTGKDAEGNEIKAIEWISGKDTKKISVQPGTYTLTEITAPKGYEVAESITFKVSVDENGNKVVTVDGKDNNGKVTMVDAYSDQTVEISKTDVGGEELEGAKLSVTGTDVEGNDIEPIEWTSGKETKKISVQPGTYTLTETTAPNGYEVAESITFKVAVDEDGNTVVTVNGEDNNGKVTMVDAYSNQEVEISKTDIGGKELPGAKLSVTGKDTTGKDITPIEWTSGKETKKISVQPGTYTLTETTAPKGYEVAESITFTVSLDKDGNAVVKVNGEDNDGKVTMVDAYSDQTVEISKQNVGGLEIEGAKLSVTGTDVNGNEIEPIEWTSGKETKKISVQPGKYTLTETTAPKGYEVAESITFEVSVDEDGNTVVTVNGEDNNGKVTMIDDYSDQKITISKVNMAGEEIGGAKITVTDSLGNLVDEWTSEEGKNHEITLQPGLYVFHEESAPDGYFAVTDITFSVNTDGEVEVIDANGNTVEVDETGALVVTDIAVEKPDVPEDEPENPTPEKPTTTNKTTVHKTVTKTGDSRAFMIWMCAFLTAGVTAIIIFRRSRWQRR